MKSFYLFLAMSLTITACTPTKVSQTNVDYGESLEKHRASYKADFLNTEHSPLTEEGVKHLRFYPADEDFKVTATFTKTENAKPFETPTSSGKKKAYVEYGKATFTIRDTTCTISLYISLQLQKMPQYRDYLFVPFKDFTSGETTYGGGRYIDLKTSDIKGKGKKQTVVIDFNKCYNPYCAYQAEGWNCPIPPEENHLPMYIEAGEKDYLK